MSSQPDLTVKQAVEETKTLAAEAPQAIAIAKSDIFLLEKTIVQAVPGTPLAKQVTQISNSVATGLVQADEAAAGIVKLIHQFGLPLAIAGGMKLQGSGAVVGAVTNAEGKLMQGVRFALTHKQKIVSDAAGILTILSIAAGIIGQIWPQFFSINIADGTTIGVAVQGLKSVIIPRLNQYADTKNN